METCRGRGGGVARRRRDELSFRTPDSEPPYAFCLPYGGMCAIHDTSQKVAGAGQNALTKDDHGSLLPPSQRTIVGETSASAVDAVALLLLLERERDFDRATIPEELSPWLAGPVFIPSSPAGW